MDPHADSSCEPRPNTHDDPGHENRPTNPSFDAVIRGDWDSKRISSNARLILLLVRKKSITSFSFHEQDSSSTDHVRTRHSASRCYSLDPDRCVVQIQNNTD